LNAVELLPPMTIESLLAVNFNVTANDQVTVAKNKNRVEAEFPSMPLPMIESQLPKTKFELKQKAVKDGETKPHSEKAPFLKRRKMAVKMAHTMSPKSGNVTANVPSKDYRLQRYGWSRWDDCSC
jgi:hypothetical protein